MTPSVASININDNGYPGFPQSFAKIWDFTSSILCTQAYYYIPHQISVRTGKNIPFMIEFYENLPKTMLDAVIYNFFVDLILEPLTNKIIQTCGTCLKIDAYSLKMVTRIVGGSAQMFTFALTSFTIAPITAKLSAKTILTANKVLFIVSLTAVGSICLINYFVNHSVFIPSPEVWLKTQYLKDKKNNVQENINAKLNNIETYINYLNIFPSMMQEGSTSLLKGTASQENVYGILDRFLDDQESLEHDVSTNGVALQWFFHFMPDDLCNSFVSASLTASDFLGFPNKPLSSMKDYEQYLAENLNTKQIKLLTSIVNVLTNEAYIATVEKGNEAENLKDWLNNIFEKKWVATDRFISKENLSFLIRREFAKRIPEAPARDEPGPSHQ
jgi:hypothetical protein